MSATLAARSTLFGGFGEKLEPESNQFAQRIAAARSCSTEHRYSHHPEIA